MSTSLLVSLLTFWQALSAPRYPHDNVLDASVNYNGMGDDYIDYQCYTPLANASEFERGGSEFSIPRAEARSATVRSYLSGQYSTTERNRSPSLSDGETPGFQDSEVASRPHGGSFEVRPYFYTAHAIQIFSEEVAVVERTNPLLSPPASAVWNQGTTQASTEPPPVGVNDHGIQRPSRRKRSASPGGRHKGKRTRRKTKRHIAAREQTQVSLAGIGLTQKGIVTVVVLNGPGYYTLAHAPRSLHGGTYHVPTTGCAERPATFVFDRVHSPGGREEARRDQPRRCLEPTIHPS
jgi:hypothetical protein